MGTHPIFESDFDCLTDKKNHFAAMAMSGVKVNDACIKMWEQLKSKKIKACNFKLSDNLKEIIVEDGSTVAADNPDAWKAWTDSLPDKECRYGIYDVNMQIDMGSGLPAGIRTKLVFVVWAPATASIKKKLDGFQVEWQLTGRDELEVSDRISDMACLADIRTSGNGILTFENRKA